MCVCVCVCVCVCMCVCVCVKKEGEIIFFGGISYHMIPGIKKR